MTGECPHGMAYPTDEEVDSRDIEYYTFCDCCGLPMHKDAYYILRDPSCGLCPECEAVAAPEPKEPECS